MNINKSSWHYWIYSCYYSWRMKPVPKQSSLCKYFWTVVFGGLLSLLLAVVIGGLYFAIFFIKAAVGWFFGLRPSSEWDISDFEEAERFKLGRLVFYPYEAAGALIILFGFPYLYVLYPESWGRITLIAAAWSLLAAFAWLHQKGAIKAIKGIGGRKKSPQTQKNKKKIRGADSGWELAKAYLKAKKERICPLIVFKDE